MEKFAKDMEALLWTAFRWYLGAFLVFLAFIALTLIVGLLMSA